MSQMFIFWPQEDTLKIQVDIFIRSVSGRGGQEGGYLEDVEGSRPETWRTGSSLMLWMYLVDPKDDILKVSCHYIVFLLRYGRFRVNA